jgi:hypothetical protein
MKKRLPSVEKIAEELYEAAKKVWEREPANRVIPENYATWDRCDSPHRKAWLAAAKAALKIMTEYDRE